MNDILLGLSGGVDSAVCAALLLEQGYNVTACFLMLTENSSPESEEAKNAESIARHLGIKLIKADYRERFKEYVSDYFIKEYLSGKTPNPCVRCNPTCKIFCLQEEAKGVSHSNEVNWRELPLDHTCQAGDNNYVGEEMPLSH